MDTNNQKSLQNNGPLSALPLNKTAQFLFGLLILFVAFKLWWSGWFSTRLFEATGIQPTETDGVENPVGILPFVMDSFCLVGVLGFWALSFSRGLVSNLYGWIKDRVDESPGMEQGFAKGSSNVTASLRQIDGAKLTSILSDHGSRIDELEKLHPEAFPEPPVEPTVEELLKEVRELKQQLSEQNPSVQDSQDPES